MMAGGEELNKLEVELKEMDRLNNQINKYFSKKNGFIILKKYVLIFQIN